MKKNQLNKSIKVDFMCHGCTYAECLEETTHTKKKSIVNTPRGNIKMISA